jgi:hypothetical protein
MVPILENHGWSIFYKVFFVCIDGIVMAILEVKRGGTPVSQVLDLFPCAEVGRTY